MMRILIMFIAFVFMFSAQAGPKTSDTATQFGGKITETKTVPMQDIIANYDQYEGKTVTFEATTQKVCEAKGCWMVLKDGDREVRTLFKDYGFFVPKTILGKKVRVQGKMKKKHISAATLRHFKKDEGAKLEEIQKIKTGKVDYEFVADAVEII